MNNMKRILLIVLLVCSVSQLLTAQTFKTKDERMDWWKQSRFGMFIHWGPVSLKGTEIGWSRGNQVPVEEYDNLYKQFDPEKFNADQWVSIAKAAGMKYIVLTTKHHDGFCLWNTKQTDHNIMYTPFHRDVVDELSKACKKQGIAFGAYYSTCDWYNHDFPLTSPGGKVARATSNLDAYTNYLKRQIAELLLNYGPLATLWFDVPQKFDSIIGQMMEKGMIQRIKTEYYGMMQTRYIPLAKADLTEMKASEKEVIDKVIEQMSDWSASAISNYSHLDMPWLASKEGEEINYELAFYRDAPFSVRNYGDEIDEQ